MLHQSSSATDRLKGAFVSEGFYKVLYGLHEVLYGFLILYLVVLRSRRFGFGFSVPSESGGICFCAYEANLTN